LFLSILKEKDAFKPVLLHAGASPAFTPRGVRDGGIDQLTRRCVAGHKKTSTAHAIPVVFRLVVG
jgi:hypothetical protein